MYIYTPLRTKLYPTIAQVNQAIRLADLDDAKNRDPRPLMSILSRISKSPRLSGHILTRETAISSYPWRITSEDESLDAANVQRRLTPAIGKILSNHWRGPLFGSLVLDLSWTPGQESKEIVPRVNKIFAPVEVEAATDGTLSLLDDSSQVKRTPILEDDPGFLSIVVPSDWIGGQLRSILFHELLRDSTLQEWNNFNKKLKGLIQGTYTDAALDEEVSNAALALKNFVSSNYVVTSKEIEFKLNELANARGFDSFEKTKNALEADIAIAILGQANTSELPDGGGSRAAVQVLNLIRADIHFSDMIRVQEFVNQKLLLLDYQFNVNKTADFSPFRFEFIHDDSRDVESEARTIETLQRARVPIKKSEAYARVGYSVPLETDDVLDTPDTSSL